MESSRIEADIRVLSGDVAPAAGEPPFRSRAIDHPDHDRARAWLKGRLQGIEGLSVREEPFVYDGVDVANLIADLPGEPGEPWVIVGAHYDSTATASADWTPLLDSAPGADDDASGVAVVLELARLLAAQPLRKSVRFVLFDAEERGLQGAWVHADGLAAQGTEVALMLSLDPVGYNPGDWLFFTFDPRWPETYDGLVDAAARQNTWLDVVGFDRHKPGLNGDARSDQYAFWENGYPALHLGTFPQPPSYHTVDDTFEVVDVAFTTEVARVVIAQVVAAAEPVPEASSGGCGCRAGPPAGAGGLLLLLAITRRRHTS